MRKQSRVALCVAIGMGSSVLQAAYLIEVDTDGLDNGIFQFSPDFAFGGDTTSAGQSLAASTIGLSGGDSIFGGNGNSAPDTYVFSYAPDSRLDNLYFDPGTPLGGGNYASGATGGGPGRYAVYATWPTSSNVNGGLTSFRVETAGDTASLSVDQNGRGNEWVKVGEIDHTSGLITVTQIPSENTYVSMRSAGVLFERMSDSPGGGYTGSPGPVFFGLGASRTFGLAFARNRAAAQTNRFSILQSTNLVDWSSTDLKLISITDLDAETDLVTFRLMAPMAEIDHQFLKVQMTPKMLPTVPFVAMTFDDGPHPEYTPALLDLLAERNIRATFYVVGSNARKYPHILRRMINEGHEIGNHSLNHLRLTDLSDEAIIAEMLGCHDAAVAASTLPPATMRPPYGAVNDSIRNLVLNEFGYPTILWDVDPLDWDMAVTDEEVVDTILNESDHGEIILTHDIHARTIAVMPEILDGLLAQDFSFVTVTELLEFKGN